MGLRANPFRGQCLFNPRLLARPYLQGAAAQAPTEPYVVSLAREIIDASRVPWTQLHGPCWYRPNARDAGYTGFFVADSAAQARCGTNTVTPTEMVTTVGVYLSQSPEGNVPEALAEDGTRQAGNDNPCGNFDLIDIVYSHFKRTGPSLWQANRAALLQVLEYPSTLNHLVYTESAARTWGFEAVTSGYAGVASVYRYRAYKQCAEMDLAAGHAASASALSDEAAAIRSAIATYLWDEGRGLLYRCTGDGLHSAVATAYAVILDALTLSAKTAARGALSAGVADHSVVKWGHVRQYPAPEEIPAGDYQEFWACFTGWMGLAIGGAVGQQVMDDFTAFYAGKSGAPWEIINAEGGKTGLASEYSQSAANAAQFYVGPWDR